MWPELRDHVLLLASAMMIEGYTFFVHEEGFPVQTNDPEAIVHAICRGDEVMCFNPSSGEDEANA